MKSILACVLLALVPLSSVRMVCLTGPLTSASVRAAIASQQPAEMMDPECERICLRRSEPPPPVTSAATCLLIADPACEFLATGAVAVIPREPLLPAQSGIARLEDRPSADYIAPTLAHRSPPPRAGA